MKYQLVRTGIDELEEAAKTGMQGAKILGMVRERLNKIGRKNKDHDEKEGQTAQTNSGPNLRDSGQNVAKCCYRSGGLIGHDGLPVRMMAFREG